jgi:ABC-type spermidine/putrescine transport system permease subunit I
MIGNVIDQQLSTPLFQAEGAVFSIFLLLLLVVPMIYYVVSTNRTGREAV